MSHEQIERLTNEVLNLQKVLATERVVTNLLRANYRNMRRDQINLEDEIYALKMRIANQAGCINAQRAEITEQGAMFRAEIMQRENGSDEMALRAFNLRAENETLRAELAEARTHIRTDNSAVIQALQEELVSVKKDAGRYRWLKLRQLAADFDYGESRDSVLVFSWPASARISADLDASIDAAIDKLSRFIAQLEKEAEHGCV